MTSRSRHGTPPGRGRCGGTRGARTRGLGRRRRGGRRSGARRRPGPRRDRRAAGGRPAGWPHRDRRGQLLGQHQLSLWSLADALPQARWVRAFNSLSVNVMADDNHREPPWVLFLSGDEEVKPAAAQLIRDAGFDPVDLGGIDDSQLQDPGSRPKPSGTGHPRLCGGGCSACSSCRPMTWRRCWHGWNPVADILQAGGIGESHSRLHPGFRYRRNRVDRCRPSTGAVGAASGAEPPCRLGRMDSWSTRTTSGAVANSKVSTQ